MTLAMPKYFVGIDQSLTHPGIAIVDDQGRLVHARTVSVGRLSRGAPRLDEIYRAIHSDMLKALSEVKACYAGAAVEGFSAGSTHREFDLGEVSGLVRWALYHDWSLDPTVVAPTSLKLFATGKGHATKEEVLHAVKTVWGQDFGKADDTADAFVLAQIACAMQGDYRFTRRSQADVIQKLHDGPVKRPRVRRTTNSSNV